MSIESDARTVDDLVEKEVARELSEEAPQVRLVSASDKLIEKMRELAMRIPNGEEGGVLDEIRRIVIVMENLRTELCWEMEYNDRAGGNEDLPASSNQIGVLDESVGSILGAHSIGGLDDLQISARAAQIPSSYG